jgi:hypothetical protein
VGNTDPATHIRATQAQLNAHGRTNNGPAYWWWEYGTSQSSVQNGQGTKTPRRGPASSSNDVPLSEVVKGLTAGTTYHFRACGQDQNSSTPVCGSVLNFRTSPGESSAWAGAFGLAYARFAGATNVVHRDWRVTTSFLNGHIVMEEHEFGFPNIGGTIIPGPNCTTAVIAGDPYDRAVDCRPENMTFLEASFGNFGDQADSHGLVIPVLFSGGGGNDVLVGDTQNDTLYGGDADDQLAGNGGRDFVTGDAGIDRLFGNAGDDSVDARDGGFFDQVDCGSGTDTAYVDFVQGIPDEYNYAVSHGCETVFGSAAAAREARTAQEARLDRMRGR